MVMCNVHSVMVMVTCAGDGDVMVTVTCDGDGDMCW